LGKWEREREKRREFLEHIAGRKNDEGENNSTGGGEVGQENMAERAKEGRWIRVYEVEVLGIYYM